MVHFDPKAHAVQARRAQLAHMRGLVRAPQANTWFTKLLSYLGWR